MQDLCTGKTKRLTMKPILERVTEAEVVEWLKAQVAKSQIELGERPSSLGVTIYGNDQESAYPFWTALASDQLGSSSNLLSEALSELKRKIPTQLERISELRSKIAALTKEAKELESHEN